MRGQAFVVFANIKSAQLALTEQTNYVIFDKPMVIFLHFSNYLHKNPLINIGQIIDMACKKSDAITIMDGTYEYKDRKKISELCQQQKLKRQEKETVIFLFGFFMGALADHAKRIYHFFY